MIGCHYLAVFLSSIALASVSTAAVFVPAWDGQPGTTSALFTFETSDKQAPPSVVRNPYGSVSMLVENETTLGAGWMDPAEPFHLTRNGTGAWDLGQNGLISIVVPVSEGGAGSVHAIDLFMHVVWYQGPMGVPEYGVDGLSPSHENSVDSLLQADGPGAWYQTVWEAGFDNVTENELTLEIQAPWNGAVVESIAIYTRSTVIPEPSSLLLAGVAVGGFSILGRKRSGGSVK